MISREFGYNRQDDLRAAKKLNTILDKRYPDLKRIISKKTVFVIGAGPSLHKAIPILKEYRNIIKICADTALSPLIENGIRPQIVVTDLDGDLDSLKKIGKTCIMVIHAHGDNLEKLEFARNFRKCIGTTQTQKVGRISNFGGFTDGDRCVFLADHFGAAKIFLFGMDFGPRIGKYSNTKKSERATKLKKLQYAKMLLEWLAKKSDSNLFTLSRPIKGFKKITWEELKHNISD